MKTLFIPAKLREITDKPKILEISKKLPKHIIIAYIIQHKDYAKEIKTILQKKHNITQFIQILGCSKLIPSKQTKAILLIGEGVFHASSLAYETKIPVYLLENNKITKIPDEELKKIRIKEKSSYINFLNSDLLGILISTKPGQEKLKTALSIKNKIKNKKSYLFISNNINTKEFDNFIQIQCWINTACPRLDLEHNKIVNFKGILEH